MEHGFEIAHNFQEYDADYFNKNTPKYLDGRLDPQDIPEDKRYLFLEELKLCGFSLAPDILAIQDKIKDFNESGAIIKSVEKEFISFSEVWLLVKKYEYYKQNIPNFSDLMIQAIENSDGRLTNELKTMLLSKKGLDEIDKNILNAVQNKSSELTLRQLEQTESHREYMEEFVPKYLYHGTTLKNWKSIQNDGYLKFGRIIGTDIRTISLTNDLTYAKSHGRLLYKPEDKEQCVVLKIDTSQLDLANMTHTDPSIAVLSTMEFNYFDEIPVSAITLEESY